MRLFGQEGQKAQQAQQALAGITRIDAVPHGKVRSYRDDYTAVLVNKGCGVASSRSNSWVPIVVALIGLAGVIAAAFISSNSSSKVEAALRSPALSSVPPVDQAANPPPLLAITGVMIGRAGSDPFVSEVSTRFSPNEEVAITVRYEANEVVSNFPVRLSARIASGLESRAVEQSADISRPGNSFWTFRFKPKDGWMGSQHFIWIRINGRDAYSQQFDVAEN